MSNKQSMLGKKIIVIAEDVTFANTLENIFNFAGIEVDILMSIDDSISIIKSKKPDLIFLENNSATKITDIITILNFGQKSVTPAIVITDSSPAVEPNELIYIISKSEVDIHSLLTKAEDLISKKNVEGSKVFDITEKNVPKIELDTEGVKVLLIEDDPLLRNLLSTKFEKEKIEFEFCNSGDNAIEKVLQYKPSIVILDIMLPGKNGLDVLSEMRQIASLKDLRVVIFSNKDNDDDRLRAKELGVETFLTKAMTDLNELVYLILKKRS